MKKILFLVTLCTIFVTDNIQPIIQSSPQLTNRKELPQALDNELDFSGEWIDTNGRKWNISQHENKIIFVEAEGKMSFQGTLEGRVIKHATRTLLGKTKQKGCKVFINTWFSYEARIILSEDGNSMEYKFPDSVSKGDCVLDMRTLTPFKFTRVKAT
jgi:hypothetical protein